MLIPFEIDKVLVDQTKKSWKVLGKLGNQMGDMKRASLGGILTRIVGSEHLVTLGGDVLFNLLLGFCLLISVGLGKNVSLVDFRIFLHPLLLGKVWIAFLQSFLAQINPANKLVINLLKSVLRALKTHSGDVDFLSRCADRMETQIERAREEVEDIP